MQATSTQQPITLLVLDVCHGLYHPCACTSFESWENLFSFRSQLEIAHNSNIRSEHCFELGSSRPSVLQSQILRFWVPDLANLQGSL